MLNLRKRGKTGLVGLVIIILFFLVFSIRVYAVPTLDFNFQDPADLENINIFGIALNISYNITADEGVDESSVVLYYKTNSTASNNFNYVNGTESAGYYERSGTNESSTWTLSLGDISVYPAIYNFDESFMEQTPHETYSFTNGIQSYIKIRFFNMSTHAQYNIFEIMANKEVNNSASLRLFYCNESYTTGNPAANDNCNLFYTISAPTTSWPVQNYNHTHSIYSSHHAMPFVINTTTSMMGSVVVTETGYFLIRGGTSWNVSYITNVSREDTIQVSDDTGETWANFAGTVDSHLHFYNGTETLYYYVCASDVYNNQNCSEERQDVIELGDLPPTAPQIYSPPSGNYSRNITLKWTESLSPLSYNVTYTNLSVFELDENINAIINLTVEFSTTSLELEFDTSELDGSYGLLMLACDDYFQCASGRSESLTFDNTEPIVSLESPVNGSTSGTNTINFNYNASDANSVVNCSLIIENSGGDTSVNLTGTAMSKDTEGQNLTVYLHNGDYNWTVNCTDDANNEGTSETRELSVSFSSGDEGDGGNGGGSGGGGGTSLSSTGGEGIIEIVNLATGGEAGEIKTLSFSKNVGVTDIIVTLQNSVNQISVTVEKLSVKPAEISIPTGQVYYYLKIDKNLKDESSSP